MHAMQLRSGMQRDDSPAVGALADAPLQVAHLDQSAQRLQPEQQQGRHDGLQRW